MHMDERSSVDREHVITHESQTNREIHLETCRKKIKRGNVQSILKNFIWTLVHPILYF